MITLNNKKHIQLILVGLTMPYLMQKAKEATEKTCNVERVSLVFIPQFSSSNYSITFARFEDKNLFQEEKNDESKWEIDQIV